MASHSGYPHVLHHLHPQPGAHLPPPPLSIGQAPNQRLPSLRSLNFAYPPVGEPGTTAIDGGNPPQQRVDHAPRTSFSPPDEYYHQREMSYYQDATSSSGHPSTAPPPAKRPRSTSNPGQRSPYTVQTHHVHSNSTSSAYQPQMHETQGRTSASAGTYTQGNPQGNQQVHTQYAPAHQPPESGHSYYSRLPQSSQAWYYSTGHQQSQQQQNSSNQPPLGHQQHHQNHHQPPQQQQQQQPPVHHVPQKHLHFQPYPAPAAPSNSHSPHQAPSHESGQAPPQPPPRATYPGHTQPQQQSSHIHGAPEASPTTGVLSAPRPAPSGGGATSAAFGSPPTPGFTASGSGVSTGGAGARAVDAKALDEDAERAAASGMHLSKLGSDAFQQITEHSSVLCEFANRYGQLPHLRPSPGEVAEMAQRATLVLQLVEHLRRMASALQPSPLTSFAVPERERERENGDEKRAGSKKRPWEDGAEDGNGASAERSGEENVISTSPFEMKDLNAMRSVADQDMAIIRSKRGQGAGGTGTSPGGTKAKYRKRSRASPPGKCHSCNIRETPEWRRGPDGARTLCNACGLHYAKLIRKRDKTMGSGADASAPPIDLEMLRQSTRVANESTPGHKPEYRDDMTEIQLQPVGGVSTMQVHQWAPSQQREEGGGGGYELGAYSTSLMRSSNARGSPA